MSEDLESLGACNAPSPSTLAASRAPERSATYGMIPGLAETWESAKSLELFRRIARVRAFELEVKKAVEKKQVEIPVYLSVGQETYPAALSFVMQGAWVVAQHRQNGTCLLFGADPAKMVDELLELPTGCNRGMGGSSGIFDLSAKILGHNHLIGENVPVAAGVAYARPGDRVLCVFGDGAAEEDYVLGALGFAATHKLPILFVCDDNDLSVLTPTRDRRSWKITDVCKGFGMPAVDITDDPWLIEHHARRYQKSLPALINVRNCRTLWHNGVGSDGPPEWDRYELVKQKLTDLGLQSKLAEVEERERLWAENLWKERLQKRSETSRAST